MWLYRSNILLGLSRYFLILSLSWIIHLSLPWVVYCSGGVLSHSGLTGIDRLPQIGVGKFLQLPFIKFIVPL